MNIPTVAFEPNVVPGFANRIVAPYGAAAAVHFEKTCYVLPQLPRDRRAGEARFFNVPRRPKEAHPTLLVFGGSQGAHAINQAMLQALPELMEAVRRIYVIHQTGERGLSRGASGISASHARRPRCRRLSTTCRELSAR